MLGDKQRESLVLFMDAIAAVCSCSGCGENSMSERASWCGTCTSRERFSIVSAGNKTDIACEHCNVLHVCIYLLFIT